MQKSTALPIAGVRQQTLLRILMVPAFTLLTALGAQVAIPTQPVPFTLQTFFVLVSGAVLGSRMGALSQCLYLTAGCIGLPVFAGWSFGAARLLGPTGGYLLAFPVAAFAVGLLLEKRTGWVWSLAAMAAGSVIIFSLGTTYLYATYVHGWAEAIAGGFLMFSWWDLAKVIAAAGVAVGYSAARRS